MAKKKYCNRCAHDMWYDETTRRWYCTYPKCVKYKPEPEPEPTPEPEPEQAEESATDTSVSGKE